MTTEWCIKYKGKHGTKQREIKIWMYSPRRKKQSEFASYNKIDIKVYVTVRKVQEELKGETEEEMRLI